MPGRWSPRTGNRSDDARRDGATSMKPIAWEAGLPPRRRTSRHAMGDPSGSRHDRTQACSLHRARLLDLMAFPGCRLVPTSRLFHDLADASSPSRRTTRRTGQAPAGRGVSNGRGRPTGGCDDRTGLRQRPNRRLGSGNDALETKRAWTPSRRSPPPRPAEPQR